MTFVLSTFEGLSGLAPEVTYLKVAEARALLGFVLVLILACSLQRASCVIRLAAWLTQFRRGNTTFCTPPDPISFSNVPAPPTSEMELPGTGLEPIFAVCQEAKSPPASPRLHQLVSSSQDGCLEMLESLESSTQQWLSRRRRAVVTADSPEAAVTADTDSVLETALSSGDAKLADAALAAGVRLCSSTWLIKAYTELEAAGIPLMPERALDLVRVFGHEHRADLAVDLWEACCAELGLDPTDGDNFEPLPAPELYGAVLDACAREGDFESAARAADTAGWRAPPCRHGQTAFLALARWYARRQDVGQALLCYQAVRDITGSADLSTHRAILIASVRSADMPKADALLQDLISSGTAPDGTMFSAMICGHCSAGNVDKAMHYFQLLRERGIVPTAPLFDAILDACALMNMPALVEQVLAEMEATGVHPSTTTLSILMRLHGMNRETEQAFALFEELPKKHNLKLDGHAYGTLISVCLKSDAYEMAWDAFERMSAASLVAHARIYESLIAACLRRGHLDNAVRAVDEALGMSKNEDDEPVLALPRFRLESKTLEDVLRLIGRRRQSARLGAPLIERLLAGGVELSESLVSAVLRAAAAAAAETPCSELHRRRAQRCEWRNFPDSTCARSCS